MKRNKVIYICLLLVNSILPTTVGSNTAVNATYPVGNTAFTATPNTVNGFAIMTGGFSLANPATALTWNSFYPTLSTTSLNGGNITLTRDFIMGGNATFVTGGTFTCGGFSVVCPQTNTTFSMSGSNDYIINGGTLRFHSPVILNSQLLFQGTCILDGGGNTITLGSSGQIGVNTGGSLLIKNATLQGVSAGQLFCEDITGSMTLQSSSIILDGAYSFTLGILNIVNDVEITGSNVFAFRSTNSLIINSFAQLMFDIGTTFSYDTNNASLIFFSNNTSELYLHGANLVATGTGINLTKGTLNMDLNCTFSSSGTLGITIGNCIVTSGASDCTVNLLNNAQLTVLQGTLNYKNINASSFNMFNSYVNLIMGANTTLNLYENLTVLGSVQFGNNATLGTLGSATISPGFSQLGTLNFTTLSSC